MRIQTHGYGIKGWFGVGYLPGACKPSAKSAAKRMMQYLLFEDSGAFNGKLLDWLFWFNEERPHHHYS